MYQLRTFGGASLEGPTGPVTGRAGQRRPLALLALLAVAGDTGLSRDKIVAYLWPDTTSKRARHLLSVTLHAVRKALGSEAVLSVGDDLRLNTDRVSVDVREYEAALEAGHVERAVELYEGPFLDGFHVRGAPEFERWLDRRQLGYAQSYRGALEELAERAEERGAWAEAVSRWKERASEEPTSSRVAVRLMRALEAAGDRPAALRHGRIHAQLVEEELGVEPDPAVAEMEERLERGEEHRSGRTRDEPPPGPAAEDRAHGAGVGSTEQDSGATGASAPRSSFGIPLVIALVVIATVEIFAAFPSGEGEISLDSRRVLVDRFENRTGDPDLDELGRMAADWVTQGLTYTGFVDVVTRGTPILQGQSAGDSTVAAGRREGLDRIARANGAGTLVWGGFYRRGDSVYFQAHVTDARDRRELTTLEPTGAHVDAPVPGLEELRDRVMAALATLTDPRLEKWQRNASKPPTFEAYQAFVEGLELVTTHGRPLDAAPRFRRAAELDPEFTMAGLWEAMSLGNRGRWERVDSILGELNEQRERLAPLDRAFLDYQLARRDGDDMERLQAARRMVEIAPGSEYLKLAGHAALEANRPGEAVHHYERADPESGWLRGWKPYWVRLARAHHRLGNFERELAVARRGLDLYPDDIGVRNREILALSALGEIRDLNEALAALRELDPDILGGVLETAATELVAHGHEEEGREFFRKAVEWRRKGLTEEDDQTVQHRLALLRILRALGDLRGATEQFESLMDEAPENVYVLREGALLRARAGDREGAVELLDRMEELGASPYIFPKPEVEALLGARERAIRILQEYEERMGLSRVYLHRAPTLWSLRDYPPFQELLRARG